jgi:predicted phage-related endonuclease
MQYTISGTERGQMPIYKITGSIIPAIAGLDRFSSPMDVFMRLSGLVDPKEQTWPMTLGIEQEGLIARWAAKQTGLHFVEYPSTVHPVYEWATGSPDRVVLLEDGKVTHGLECKFRGERLLQDYGESGTDKVLDSDMAQCCFYMGIFPEVSEWYVAVQFGNRERRLFIIKRDEELIAQFYEIGREFLENHLIPQVPPPIDGSDSSKQYLNWKYPQEQGPILEPTDEDILRDITRYQYARQSLTTLEGVISGYENRLKSIIGDAAGMKGEWGKLTWTRNKDSVKIDWEKVSLDMAEQLGIAMKNKGMALNIYADFKISHSTIKPGPRVFRAYFPKED